MFLSEVYFKITICLLFLFEVHFKITICVLFLSEIHFKITICFVNLVQHLFQHYHNNLTTFILQHVLWTAFSHICYNIYSVLIQLYISIIKCIYEVLGTWQKWSPPRYLRNTDTFEMKPEKWGNRVVQTINGVNGSLVIGARKGRTDA